MTRLADRARFGIGLGCVLVAAALFVLHAPRAIRTMNATVRADAYITNPLGRELTSGDALGIPFDLQQHALQLIPGGASYALLLPADQDAAARYGISPITFATVGPFLRYLLLPAWPASRGDARYVICWRCDTKPLLGRVSWLWRDGQGEAIGRAVS